MITYVKGDIFLGKEDVLVHGCNCFHTMGSGVAAKVKEYYPEAFEADKTLEDSYGLVTKLGHYTFVTLEHKVYPPKPITVINAYTQYKYGVDTAHAEYSAIYQVMGHICSDVPDNKSIAMPKIGCGLGGRDWAVVEKILNTVFWSQEIFVYEL